MEGSTGSPAPVNRPVLPVIHPAPEGFLVRYLMAFAPLVVLAISLATSAALSGFVEGFNASLPGQVRTVMAGMDDLIQMSVLLTAPVGIYLTFGVIGWKMRFTEIWTGSAIALGLSSLAGLLFVTLSPYPKLSPSLDLLYWIAYLILPASIAAALILVAWAERFRRSISYTFTGEGILTRGGIWKRQESLLPYHRIAKVVMEQGPVDRLLHVGTIIPLEMVSGGPAAGKGRGKEASREEMHASRHPLNCLYGISSPEKVKALLEQLILLRSVIEEEQPQKTGESPASR
jgi:membrane protein YdbS with pleckstrin-like domain